MPSARAPGVATVRPSGKRGVMMWYGMVLVLGEIIDDEATVIGHQDGEGKHEGRLGALVCQLKDGTTFRAGSGFTDAERETPPAIGAIVTVRYFELTPDGVPRFPTFLAIRNYE